ncbi:amino acid permease [Phytobacter diazotrophicus]|uniref:amino acid permease n=1 Tax=Phytobacter diazotrophicus TaxID=395631 RepID=UPI002FFA3FC1
MNIDLLNNKNYVDKLPFTKYDLGWVVLCIGMAIGSGIVFLPLQVGLKGVWVFACTVIIGYPGVYFLQKLFIETLVRSDEKDSYLSIITSYLGGKWGACLGALYSLSMLKSMVVYSMAITNDSASYLKTFGLTKLTFSDYWWWPLVLIAVLSFIASKGERLLFKDSGTMIFIKLSVIVIIAFAVIPSWDVDNISSIPDVSHLISGIFPTLPFAIYSILFMQILNPMNIAYKKRENNKELVRLKILQVHKIAYSCLVIGVLFYVASVTLAITEQDAIQAVHENISALALLAKIVPGSTIKIMSVVLNVFSVVTAFLSIYLAVNESFIGFIKTFSEKLQLKMDNGKSATISFLMIVFSLWILVLTNLPIVKLVVFGGIAYGIISCIVPGVIILRNEKFSDLVSFKVYFVIFIGLMMCIAPIVMMLS